MLYTRRAVQSATANLLIIIGKDIPNTYYVILQQSGGKIVTSSDGCFTLYLFYVNLFKAHLDVSKSYNVVNIDVNNARGAKAKASKPRPRPKTCKTF